MFNEPTFESKQLQETIDQLHLNLDRDTGSQKYSNQIDQLTKLYAIQASQAKKGVSKDTLAIVAGNILGILIIVNYERANVVASKALSFVMKAK